MPMTPKEMAKILKANGFVDCGKMVLIKFSKTKKPEKLR